MKHVFADADRLIQAAFGRAMEKVNASREDAKRLRAEISEIDGRVAKLARLLTDDDLEDAAKKALGRQLADLERRRDDLHGSIARLADEANDNTEKVMSAVRQAVEEAKRNLTVVAPPERINELLADLVGPMTHHHDGTITPRALPEATDNVEGAPYATRRVLREAFWRLWPRAAFALARKPFCSPAERPGFAAAFP